MQPAGAERYCEYPANLIRIVQRFLLGVELRLDGGLILAPVATEDFWQHGFGRTLAWGGRTLTYRMKRGQLAGTYAGTSPLSLGVRLSPDQTAALVRATVLGRSVEVGQEAGLVSITLPAASEQEPCAFELFQTAP